MEASGISYRAGVCRRAREIPRAQVIYPLSCRGSARSLVLMRERRRAWWRLEAPKTPLLLAATIGALVATPGEKGAEKTSPRMDLVSQAARSRDV